VPHANIVTTVRIVVKVANEPGADRVLQQVLDNGRAVLFGTKDMVE